MRAREPIGRRMRRKPWHHGFNGWALERLLRSVPQPFPNAVWKHALQLKVVPESPARAVEAYWRAHPIRADRLSRALAAESGAPANWTWRLDRAAEDASALSFRIPPAPYREAEFSRGPGYCCICGQPVFRLGWHRDFWGDGLPNRRASWHACCVAAWKFWNAPSDQIRILKALQRRRCGITGSFLRRGAEVDHRIPLYAVWREYRAAPWPSLLRFWGLPNLQVVNRAAHAAKCAAEARDRASSFGAQTAAVGPILDAETGLSG